MLRIHKAIIHILDKETGNIVLSQSELDNSDGILRDYVEQAIKKMEKSDVRQVVLPQHAPLRYLSESFETFVETTGDIATLFFEDTKGIEAMPGSDLLFFVGEEDDLGTITGMIKLDHSVKFVHTIEYEGETLITKIIRNKSVLPSPTQKFTDGVLIVNGKCYVLEKNYKTPEGIWTLSNNFLHAEERPLTSNENVKAIKQAIKSVAKKYNSDAFTATVVAQNAVVESLESDGAIDNAFIAEEVFQTNISAKNDFMDELSEKGISEVVTLSNAPVIEKKYSNQKIKLGNGIELKVPTDILKDKEFVEFKMNEDGTTSVIIKKVEKLTNSF